MTSRHEVAESLYGNGYTPLHKEYSLMVQKFIIKKYKIQTDKISKESESALQEMAAKFTSKAKKFYLESQKKVSRMLEKKKILVFCHFLTLYHMGGDGIHTHI